MRVEHIEIEKIVPFDRSPRKNDNAVDAVAKSIRSLSLLPNSIRAEISALSALYFARIPHE